MPPPNPVRYARERELQKIPLSCNRDAMLPDLYWALDHPQLPIPNRCLVFEIDLSPEKMKEVHDWEDKQEIANFATDEELADKGVSLHWPGFSL